jgi:hypothetical protein
MMLPVVLSSVGASTGTYVATALLLLDLLGSTLSNRFYRERSNCAELCHHQAALKPDYGHVRFPATA